MARTLFTTRHNGVSLAPYASFNLATHVGDDPASVEANRLRLAEMIGVSRDSLFFMNQVHGREIAFIDENSDSKAVPSVDILISNRPGAALVTLIADCVPLLMYSNNVAAAVHVGRQGLMAGAVDAAVNAFQSLGISAGEIEAQLGPSICGGCYEVDIEMYREVVAAHPATATSEEKRSLDIASGVKARLDYFGISWQESGHCTMHDEGYFSYRRDGVTGRQAGVIVL